MGTGGAGVAMMKTVDLGEVATVNFIQFHNQNTFKISPVYSDLV